MVVLDDDRLANELCRAVYDRLEPALLERQLRELPVDIRGAPL
jgi:hypothetical protein